MLVTVVCANGKYTGEWQKGDWSKHPDFDSTRNKVMTKDEFDKAIAKENEAIAKRNRAKSIITLDEIYNDYSRDEAYQDNLWK